MEKFVFHTNNKEVTNKVKAGIIPAGYYESQDTWRGDTVYYYYDFNQEDLDDLGTTPAGTFWLDEFRPEGAEVSADSLEIYC